MKPKRKITCVGCENLGKHFEALFKSTAENELILASHLHKFFASIILKVLSADRVKTR